MPKEIHHNIKPEAVKPETTPKSPSETAFSPENKQRADRLGSSAKELIMGVFRSASEKIQDSRIGAKITAWFSGKITQGVEQKINALSAQKSTFEGKSAEHSAAPGKIEQEYADLEKLAKERGIPLDPNLAGKLNQEKKAHQQQVEKYQSQVKQIDEQLGSLSEKRNKYQEKRETAVGKICQKWEGKIAGNNAEKAAKEGALEKINSKLEEFNQNKGRLTDNIAELENMLSGISSKALQKEVQKAIKTQEQELKRLEKEERSFQKEKEGLEKSMDRLDRKNKKLERHIEKYKPKKAAGEAEPQMTRAGERAPVIRRAEEMTLQDVLASVQASREKRREQREGEIRKIAQAIYDARIVGKDNYSEAGITVPTSWDYVDNVLLKKENLTPGSPEATEFMKKCDWEQAEKIYEAKMKQEEQGLEEDYEERTEAGLRRRLGEQMKNKERFGYFVDQWNSYLSGKNRDLELRNVPYGELDQDFAPEEALEKIKNLLIKEKPQEQRRINVQAEIVRYLFQ